MRSVSNGVGLSFLLVCALIAQGCGQSHAGTYTCDVDATIAENPALAADVAMAVIVKAGMMKTAVELVIRDDGTFSIIRATEGRAPVVETGNWVESEGGLTLTGPDGVSVQFKVEESRSILVVPDGSGNVVFRRSAD